MKSAGVKAGFESTKGSCMAWSFGSSTIEASPYGQNVPTSNITVFVSATFLGFLLRKVARTFDILSVPW